MMMNGQYRRCAGVVVFNKKGQVLLCNRKGYESAWQFPQGGIEANETVYEAGKRELFEETSITSVKLVCFENEPLRYEFSKEAKEGFRKRGILSDGQDICFSLFEFVGDEKEINLKTLEPEFDKYMWSNFEWAIENVIYFKQDVYKKVALKFEPIIEQYLKKVS